MNSYKPQGPVFTLHVLYTQNLEKKTVQVFQKHHPMVRDKSIVYGTT